MNRYLFQVQYAKRDGTGTYEPVCVDAATEAEARTQVLDATKRYASAIGATRTLTVKSVTLDV